MVKSLALQAELAQEFGTCVFDVTLDCEDGAAVGAEKDHAFMVQAFVNQTYAASKNAANELMSRVAARVHPVDHPAFAQDVEIIVGGAAQGLCHVMLPKVDSRADWFPDRHLPGPRSRSPRALWKSPAFFGIACSPPQTS